MSREAWRQKARPWCSSAYCIVLLLLMSFLSKPYFGVGGDAIFYGLQAFYRLYPGRLSSDLFFLFGSQDNFTIFTALYSPLVEVMGLGGAHAAVARIAVLLWFGCLLFFARTIFPERREFIFACAGVLLLNQFYGHLGNFRYSEQLAIPRPFSEALVVAGIAFTLRERFAFASISVLAAGFLHPIMALPGAAILAWAAVGRHRWLWYYYVLASAVVIALGAVQVEPFGRIFLRMSDAAFEVVRRRNYYSFVSDSGWGMVINSIPAIVVLALASKTGQPVERRFIRYVAWCSSVGVASSFLLADLAKNSLMIAAQAWRVLWLLTVAGNAFAPVLVFFRLQRGCTARLLGGIALAVGFVERVVSVPPVLSAIVWLLAGVVYLLEHRAINEVWSPILLMVGVFTTVVLALVGCLIWIRFEQLAEEHQVASALAAIGAMAMLCVSLIFIGVKLSYVPRVLWGVPIVASIIGLGGLDRRTEWQKYLENDQSVDETLTSFLAGTKNVYWEGGEQILWFKLRRPSYYSCNQGAGVLFFERTAFEFRARQSVLERLSNLESEFHWCRSGRTTVNLITGKEVDMACRELSDLDGIILARPANGVAAAAVWHPPVPVPFRRSRERLELIHSFFLYKCSEKRVGEPQ